MWENRDKYKILYDQNILVYELNIKCMLYIKDIESNTKGVFRALSNICMKLFWKNSYRLEVFNYFRPNCLDSGRVLYKIWFPYSKA